MRSSNLKSGCMVVRRTSQYTNRIRPVGVFVDGKKVGQLKDGESKSFELSPGEHRVFAKVAWYKTPLLAVRIERGETVDLVAGSEITGWKIFLAAFYLFVPDKWIYLKLT
jgi:hypothetical protein